MAGGRRVVIRLHDKSLHHRLVIDPYLHVGEAYMDGTLTLEAGLALRFSRHLRGQRRAGRRPSPEPGGRCAQPPPAPDPSIQSGAPRPGQCSASLRPVRHAVRPVPRCRPPILVRLFHPRPRRPGAGATGQEAPPGGQAAAEAGHADPRHRFGLGRPRALSGRGGRRRGRRHHAVARSSSRSAGSVPQRRWSGRSRALRAVRLPRDAAAGSTGSSRSACSSTSASGTIPSSSARCATC